MAVINMSFRVGFSNLWVFYVLAYAIAFPLQIWANNKRGKPFDDPEFLYGDRKIFPIAMAWLFGGLAISLFVPVHGGAFFYLGLLFYVGGLVLVAAMYYSFAHHPGLVTTGVHRYSRNPGYVGWAAVMLGLALMGLSPSVWSLLFVAYFLVTVFYFHWTVRLEEAFLVGKYGDSYRDYVNSTSRYFSIARGTP